ncbi:acyl-CoA thioester hydrolase [Bisgaardia hudsonensis]|uniref:Acyl-CoA thioester hydrolase n=1 Tax=Bisgaardia hudsonensis TaxID=109472 RepID=A0A4R2N295_9PAST|nr:tol-pal system-associated acyl-CoA thioesterase [Bisgaardia hudsonensis]QLB12441.1 tol-pal system-associated acyl-CoA thioesterase [Bisgaardia hudsonensis]TCP13976.1 acyl-CoA thioester hydrolase [Bisgaardia hudsonensis]
MDGFKYFTRVYYEDTDAGGVVYHANYLHFFERARTEYLRALGFSQRDLLNRYDLAFVVKSMSVDFCAPASLDDSLLVETRVKQIKAASMLFTQAIICNDKILCGAEVKIACVNLKKMKPVIIPNEIKTAFSS